MAAIAVASTATVAQASEYRLQYTPPSGSTRVVTAGYAFDGNTVTGLCSYSRSVPCSGRYCHPRLATYVNTCTWDLFGAFLSAVPGAPVEPPLLSTNGTELVYATNGSSTSGLDTGGFGFVDTVASRYTWTTPDNQISAIADAPNAITVTLQSDGDLPLGFLDAAVTTQAFGWYNATAGDASIVATTCGSSVPAGESCDVTFLYDPTSIACTNSPYGDAYTGIQLSIETDSPASYVFGARFTVTGVPLCDD